MTSIVAGEGLGVGAGWPATGTGSISGLGQGGGELYVNATTGNLVLQVQDEWLSGAGPDIGVIRTYNSQGLADDDNGDNWRIGLYRSITALTGAVNTTGSTVTRVDGDGMRRVYLYESGSAKYVSRDGEGAADTLTYASSRWTWTDGDSRVTEIYDWTGSSGKLLETSDIDGNKLTYTYTGNLLTQVLNASGERTLLDYSGNNLTQVRTQRGDGSTVTRVRYGYDTGNRLNRVTVDLTPDDNSIVDGNTYVTTYTYDGSSKRVASIAQSDGTGLSFTYMEVAGRHRLASVTNTLGRTTSYSYAQAGWTAGATLESLGAAAHDAQVKFDAFGNGYALWSESGNLWVRRYDKTNGAWHAAVNLSQRTSAVGSPQLAVDPGGRAIVAWVQSDGVANSIHVSRYDTSTGTWTAAVVLDGLSTPAADPQVAINAAGRAIVVWRQPASGTTSPNNLYASRFDGTAWTSQALLESGTADITAPASVALDQNGNVCVAWLQDATANIYLVRYTAATNTWTTPSATAIESGASAASNVQLAFDGRGNGQVIYIQSGNLYARSYTAGTAAWGPVKTLENGSAAVLSAHLSISASGQALVSWVQSDGSANMAYARRYVGGTWLNNAANADTGDAMGPAAGVTGAIAENGDAVVLWRQPSGSVHNLMARRFMAGGWQATESIESNANDVTQLPSVAIDADGSVQAVWQQSDGTAASIFGTRFAPAGATQTDPTGQAVHYTLDSRGRLAAVQSPTGSGTSARASYAYDHAGRLLRQTDANGATTVYEYDANGNQTLMRDSQGNTVARTFGSRNELLTETVYRIADPDGPASGLPTEPLTTRHAYDAENHLRFTVSAEGRVTEYRYSAQGQEVARLQYTGNTYNVTGLAASAGVSESTLAGWAAGTSVDRTRIARTDITYDFRGLASSETRYAKTDSSGNGISDGSQATTQFIYDAAGRLLQRIEPRGVATTDVAGDFTTRYTYDGLGRVLTVTDALGRVTTTQYDATNRKIVVMQANGLTAASVFDQAGQLVSHMQVDGTSVLEQTRHWYDTAGRLRMTQDATGVRQHFLYDAAGLKVADIGPNGYLTEYTYDAAGRLVRTLAYATALSGSALANLVDANGNPGPATLASLRPAASSADVAKWIFYDTAGRVLKTVDGEGAVVQHGYDGAGRLVEVLGYANTVNVAAISLSTHASDAAVSPAATANDRKTRHFYDADGLLQGSLDAEGYLVEHQYDGAGRLQHTVRYTLPTPAAQWAAGTLAQLRPSAAAGDAHSWRFYDGRGNLVAEVDAEGYLTEYIYDANGQLLQQLAYANRALLSPTAITAATTLGALRPSSNPRDQVSHWTYTGLGKVATSTDAQGTVTRYTYDSAGNVVQVDRAHGTAEVRTLQTRYDKLGRVAAELSAQGSAALAVLGAPTQAQIDALWLQYGVRHAYDQAGRRISTIDAAGHRTLYYYAAEGRLVYTINALGEVSELRYDAHGRQNRSIAYGRRINAATLEALSGGLVDAAAMDAVAAVADANLDQTARTGYDRRGLATAHVDAFGNTDYSAYNAFGELTYTTDRIDSSTVVNTRYVLDRRGLLISKVDDHGGLNVTTGMVRDAFGRTVQTIDANGQARNTQYDRLGREVQTVDALGVARSITYDAFGRIMTQTDGMGQVTRYAYDQTARSVAVTTPEGITVTTRTNRHGEVVSVTDGLGRTSTRSYDADGRLLQEKNPLGQGDTRSHDAAGRLVETTDASGIKTRLSYDAAGRVVTRTVDPGGLNLVTTYAYDAQGRTIEVTDPSGVVTRTIYDRKGQVAEVTVDPAGLNLRTTYAYDARGRTLSVTQGAGTAAASTSRYVYDKLGRRIAEQIDPAGLNLTTQYAYDANGNVVAKTDAAGHTSRYAYDGENRLVYSLDPLGGVTRTDYDAVGRVATISRYATPVQSLSSYTVADFAARVNPDLLRDRVEHNVYDRDGRLVYAIDALGHVVHTLRDANGRAVQVTQYAVPITVPSNVTTAAVSAALSADAAADRVTRKAYDAAGREVYEVDALGYVTQTVHDAAGRVRQSTRYARPVVLEGAALAAGAVQGALVSDASDRTSYMAYDTAGRVAYQVDPEGHVAAIFYDAAGRVTQQTSYPASVGILSAPPTHADLRALLPSQLPADAVVVRQSYDSAGRLVTSTDGEGIVTRRVLDALGRTTSLVTGDGRSDAATTRHSYDTTGHLIETVVGDGSLDLKTRYVYDAAGNRVATIDARGIELAETDSDWAKGQRAELGYVNGSGQVLLASQLGGVQKQALLDRYTSRDGYDALGRKIASTDALGATTHYTYDAFDQLVKVTDPMGRSGYFYYDKLGRRTLQVDPLGYVVATSYDFAGAVTSQTRHVNSASGSWSESAPPSVAADAARDRITTTVYDRLGRRTRETDAEGQVQSWTYDARGNAASYTNALGGTTLYAYDRRGLLTRETLPVTSKNAAGADVAVVHQYSYDARGNRTVSIEAVGLPEQRATTYVYDRANRLVTKQGTAVTVFNAAYNAYVATPTESYSYDARGNVVQVDANGRKAYAWYDAAGRKVAAVDAAGNLTRWTLDAVGNTVREDAYADAVSVSGGSLPAPANAANVRTTYSAFDANNRIVRTWRIADHVYDLNGGLRSSVQVGVQNFHDANGNLVRSIDANGNSTWTYYDRAGRKITQVDAEGYGVAWSYDDMGSVTVERRYAGQLSAATLASLSATTDVGALRAEFVGSPDVSSDRITTFAYDRMGRLKRQSVMNVAHASVSATNGSLTESTGEVATFYTYNGLGKLLTVTDANGNAVTRMYDVLGRETRVTYPSFTGASGAQLAARTDVVYDGLGQVLERTERGAAAADDRTVRRVYNANGWLTSETDALGNVVKYAYDVHGNIVRKTANRLESVGTATASTAWEEQVAWFVPNGTGTRAVANPIVQSAGSLKAVIADWNGNGRSDVLWYDVDTGSNRWYLDNGDGTFQVQVNPIAAADLAGGSGLLTGDFNGDGRTDLLCWNKATGSNLWFMRNADGSWTKTVDRIAPAELKNGVLHVVNWNGDARADLLWHDPSTGTNNWYTSNADGSLTKTSNRIPAAEIKNGNGLFIGDFNGDGRSDVLWYDRTTGTNLWYYTNADGSVTKVSNAIAVGDLKNGTGVYVGDWSGNGTADVLWYDSTSSAARWYQGTASRTFTAMGNPIAATTAANAPRYGDTQGNGLLLRDETRYVYDALDREIRRDDVVTNVRQNTRYNAYGEITGTGYFDQWTETTEYDNLGRVWRSNAGNGIAKAYVYDAAGNATLNIESAGAALSSMSLPAMLSSSDVKATINVYDRRNRVVQVIEPQMTYTHEDAAIQSVQVAQGGDPFTTGLMLLSNGGVTTEMTVATSGATRFAIFKLTLPSTAAWGDGDLEVQVVRADGPHVGTTTHVFANTTGSITLPQLAWGQYIPPDSYNPNPRWIYDQTIKIKVVKKTDFGNVLVSDETRKFYLNSGQQTSLSGSSVLPKQLHFKGQPLAADNVRLKYRAAGSTGAYTEAVLSKYQINGTVMTGWFAFDWSALAANTYEYVYEAIDADNGDKVLNRVSGSFKIDGANTAVQSQTAQALDPVYVTQLQWVITGQQSQAHQVRRSQTHNAFGEVVSETDGLGRRTDFTYNTLGLLTAKIDPETSITLANGYVSRGRPKTTYYYDRLGQAVGTQDANGHRTTMRYLNTFAGEEGQLEGQVEQQYFADSGTVAYQYDEFGQQRLVTDQLGRVTRNSYDKNGNLVAVDRPGGNDDVYHYDLYGNRTGRVDALGGRETWRYDGQGRITQAVSAAGRRTDISYRWVSDGWATANADDALSPGGGANALATAGGWLKLTSQGGGRTLQELTDVHERLRWKRDLGGADTQFVYNQAGWLLSQTSDRGQNISYTYYDNGNVRTITDLTTDTFAKFEYDGAGNRTFEGYTSTPDAQGNRTYFQYSTIAYDELNRVKSVESADYRIDYEYDAVGNRRHMLSRYHDGLNGNVTTQDYWYLYDSMNRFVVTKGVLSGGRAADPGAAARIVKGSTGLDLQYDLAGQRRVATYGNDGHREDYAYSDDGFLTSSKIDGTVRAVRTNDALGRVTNYKEYNADGSARTDDTTTYDRDGRVLKQHDNLTSKGSNYAYATDGTLASTTSYGEATTVTTTYAYEWFDTAREKEIKIQASNQSAPGWKPGYSKFTYDANGNLKLVEDVAANRSLRYTTSGEGQVLRRQELVGTSISKTHNFYYANGKKVGDIGNDGQSQEDYAQLLAKQKNLSASEQNRRYKPQSVADFDQNYEPVDAAYPAAVPGSYVVRSGDTLQSIARAVWGDASLWYLIADANGLNASSTLTTGQNLVIPNKVTNVHNNAGTFSVYQPGSAIGNVSPSLPDAPAPQVKKSSKGNKAGGCGKVLLGVLVAVVAVVATVVTAGAFMVAATPLTMSAGPMAMLGAGASAVSGGAATWAGVGAAALGAAAGSAVGQGLSIMTGLQEKFSWSQVAASSLTAGATAGLAKVPFLPKIGVLRGKLGSIANAAMGGAATGAASQLALKLVNPGTAFNWSAVAGAAAGNVIDTLNFLPARFARSHPVLSKGVNTFGKNALTQQSKRLLGLQQGVDWRAAGGAAGGEIIDALGKSTYVPLLQKVMSQERAKRFDGVVREVVQEGVRWGLMRKKPELGDLLTEGYRLARTMMPHGAGATASRASHGATPATSGSHHSLGTLLARIAGKGAGKALEEAGIQLGRLALSALVTHKPAQAFSFSRVAAAGVAGGLSGWVQAAVKPAHPAIASVLGEGISGARGAYFSGGSLGQVALAFTDGLATKAVPAGNDSAGYAMHHSAYSSLHGVRWRSDALASMGISALGKAAHLFLGAVRNGTLGSGTADGILRAVASIGLGGVATGGVMAYKHSGAAAAGDAVKWIDAKLGAGGAGKEALDRMTGEFAAGESRALHALGDEAYTAGVALINRLSSAGVRAAANSLHQARSSRAQLDPGPQKGSLFETYHADTELYPELVAMVNQPNIRRAIERAFRETFHNSTGAPVEQGGWILEDKNGTLIYRPMGPLVGHRPTGLADVDSEIRPGRTVDGKTVRAVFHTHPTSLSDGYDVIQSPADMQFVRRLDVPGIIATRYGMVYYDQYSASGTTEHFGADRTPMWPKEWTLPYVIEHWGR